MTPSLKSLGHDFDPDNPVDVDWLFLWAKLAETYIRDLEARVVRLIALWKDPYKGDP